MVYHRDKRSRSFQSQNYHQLRKECLKKKQLFVDVTFPPTNSSLFLDQDRTSEIVWKRPGEIVKDPKLFVEGASPNDVTQGILGNCWFVSACSALTHNEELIKKVIPDANSQEWSDQHPYCGIFRFSFWRYGSWFEVIIDDLLPTKDGKLLFARSKTPNEFWSALLEKAFAKLYGCYENLVGGQLADALQDVSGGVAETINVKKMLADGPTKEATIRLFKTLQTAFDQQALIVAAIQAKNKEDIEKSLSCGLVKGHAYAVTAVRYIELDAKSKSFFKILKHHDDRQMMIRLQNPWGEREWNGPWSDGSPEWEQVTPAQKTELGITIDEDGDFWMPWEEFVKYFTDISVCQLFNTRWLGFVREYNEYIFFDEWTTNGVKLGDPRDRSGGCQNFAATFCFNPQYRFDVSTPANDVMIALTQKEVYNESAKQRDPFVTIGIHVMKVESNRHFRIHQSISPIGTSDYASARSVYLHLTNLSVGRYIIMPTTYAPREQAEYMLRVYSKEDIGTKLLKKDLPKSMFITCHRVVAVSRITIIEATFLSEKDSDIYCYIKTDDDKGRSSTVRGGYTAKWDEMFIFYRHKLQQEYHLEIWEDRTLKDKPIGKCTLTAAIENDTRTVSLDIQCAHSHTKESIGTLTVEISSFDDPMYL